MSMICTNCGSELREGAKFCPNCGAKAEPAVQMPAEPVYSAPQEPQEPVYEAPSYPAPEQPQETPYQAPAYSAPVQPGQPVYGQPAPPNAYQPAPGPQQGYAPAGQPQQPPYYAPNGAPGQYGQPPYGAPAYGAPGYGAQPQPKKKGKAGLIIGIIIGVIVIAVGVVLLIMNLGGGSQGASTPEAVITEFGTTVDKMFKGNATFEDMLGNIYEWNYMKPEKKSEFQKEIDESAEEFNSGVALIKAFYSDISITCKVTDTKTMTPDEMKEYLDDNEISEYCDTDKITEMCTCAVTSTITYDDETQDSETEMVCIKADGKWYISMSEMEL